MDTVNENLKTPIAQTNQEPTTVGANLSEITPQAPEKKAGIFGTLNNIADAFRFPGAPKTETPISKTAAETYVADKNPDAYLKPELPTAMPSVEPALTPEPVATPSFTPQAQEVAQMPEASMQMVEPTTVTPTINQEQTPNTVAPEPSIAPAFPQTIETTPTQPESPKPAEETPFFGAQIDPQNPMETDGYALSTPTAPADTATQIPTVEQQNADISTLQAEPKQFASDNVKTALYTPITSDKTVSASWGDNYIKTPESPVSPNTSAENPLIDTTSQQPTEIIHPAIEAVPVVTQTETPPVIINNEPSPVTAISENNEENVNQNPTNGGTTVNYG